MNTKDRGWSVSDVTWPYIAQCHLSLAMHYGICGAIPFALRLVGLVSVLLVYEKTLNDTVSKSYLLLYLNYMYDVHIANVWNI